MTSAKAQTTGLGNAGGGLLPNLGSDTRMGDLRPQLQNFFQPATPLSSVPAYVLTKSIDAQVGVTDNALQANSPRRADIFTVLVPSLAISGDTARIKANISYSPQFTFYANNSSQNTTAQYGAGQALATIVPDAVFLDLRGSVSQSSLAGNGFNQQGTNTYNQQNSVQTTSFSITPYTEHRFGGWGTARLGYSFTRSLQDTPTNQQAVQNTSNTTSQLLGTPGYGAIGNLSAQRERASFASGENLGRFNDLATVELTQYSGSGSYNGAYRRELSNEVGFALTRRVTLLGGFGYQDLFFSGTPPTRINEPTWNVGVRYSVSPDSNVTLTYGHHDGSNNLGFDGEFAPTARTRVIGRYTTGITSDIAETQNVLDTTTVGPTGLVTDTATGAPVSTGSTFGVQNGIYQVKRLSINVLLLLDRDTYSVSVSNENRTSLTTTPGLNGIGVVPAGTASTSTYASLSWQHDLAPDMSTNATVQYGTSNNTSQYQTVPSQNGNNTQQRTLSVSTALTKQFSETLSGSLRYIFTDQQGTSGFTNTTFNTLATPNRGTYTQNTFLVGLRKSF